MLKLLQGFKDFILRGNVIDLAVGIVIGAAFTALVGAFTTAFIEPLIKVFGGGSLGGRESGFWNLGGERFGWASFLNALITFVLTAAVLYFFVVTPMNRLAARRKGGSEPAPKAPSEEVLLLTEIRDALVRGGVPQQRTSGTDNAATARAAAVIDASGDTEPPADPTAAR
jgi:large conductance mechanosensitive channel